MRTIAQPCFNAQSNFLTIDSIQKKNTLIATLVINIRCSQWKQIFSVLFSICGLKFWRMKGMQFPKRRHDDPYIQNENIFWSKTPDPAHFWL